MDRDYKTGKSKSVGLFSGIEIEHTPAHGLQTLFLARNDLTYEQITDLCKEVKAEAVYYGANRAYVHSHHMQVVQIEKLLDERDDAESQNILNATKIKIKSMKISS